MAPADARERLRASWQSIIAERTDPACHPVARTTASAVGKRLPVRRGARRSAKASFNKGDTMTKDFDYAAGRPAGLGDFAAGLRHELIHMRSHWLWFALLGALLVICGTAAIIFPHLTVITTFAATTVMGILLMLGGVATVISAFWAGRWSGLLLQLLVGILYIACGFVVTENPVVSALAITVFLAVSFIVLGTFRIIAALMLRFPQWGWALLNGVVTLLAGVVIYRQLPFDAFWVLGLLIGLEMLFNGWTWIMLALSLRSLPAETTA
jgi:uncharacterized membrane protein HdeD (DUF308 family)